MFITDLFWSAVKLIAGSAKFPLPNWGDGLNKISPQVYESYMEAKNVDHLEVKPGDWSTLMTLLSMQLDIDQGFKNLEVRQFAEHEVNAYLQGGPLEIIKAVHETPLKEDWAPNWAQHQHQKDAALFGEIIKFPHLSGDPFPRALSIDIYRRAVYVVKGMLKFPKEVKDFQKEEYTGSYPYYVSLKIRAQEEPKSSKNWRSLPKGAKITQLFTLVKQCEECCHK